MVATADHGFIDVPPEDSLELPPSLAHAALKYRCAASGAWSIAMCTTQRHSWIKRRQWLGERADVMPSAQLVDEGWFGPGTPHPRFAERIGDVALVMRGRYTVKDWTAGESRHLHIGNHGGTHEDEMLIPLIMETT